MTDYSELKRLAKGAFDATPHNGPDEWCEDWVREAVRYARENAYIRCVPHDFSPDGVCVPWHVDDGAYIAAANPAVILAILAELEALRTLLTAADEVRAQLFNCADDAYVGGKGIDREKQPIAEAYDKARTAYNKTQPICGVHAHYGAQHSPSLGCNEVCTELKGHDGGRHDT